MSTAVARARPRTGTRGVTRGAGIWLAGGGAIFAIALILDVSHGFSIWDESWFLQVVHRVASGEVLYRDIFFGAGPLPVYLTAALVRIFGSEIVVVKAVIALLFAATALLMIHICRRLTGNIRAPLLALALLALMPPWAPGAGVPYSPLAILLLLASLAVMLVWAQTTHKGRTDNMDEVESGYRVRRRAQLRIDIKNEQPALAAAGALAGLAVATKQDVGGYCLVLLVLTIVAVSLLNQEPRKLIFARLRLALLAFLVALLVMLMPILISGGWSNYFDFGFANKGTYAEYGQISYFDGISRLGHHLLSAPSLESWTETYSLFLYLMPFLVFPALALAWLLVPAERRRTTLIGAYVAAGFVSIFPRSDSPHLAYAIPSLLIGIVWAWHLLKRRLTAQRRIAIRAAVLLWIFAGLLFILGATLFARESNPDSPFLHFSGVHIDKDDAVGLENRVTMVKTAAAGEPLFILSPDAGFLYLAGGTTDPTPYDYPLITAFGSHGEEDVMDAIARGEIRKVLVDVSSSTSGLAASRLQEYVQKNMTPAEPDAGFILYRSR